MTPGKWLRADQSALNLELMIPEDCAWGTLNPYRMFFFFFIHVYVCVVCMHICMHVWRCVGTCACACVYTCVCICACTCGGPRLMSIISLKFFHTTFGGRVSVKPRVHWHTHSPSHITQDPTSASETRITGGIYVDSGDPNSSLLAGLVSTRTAEPLSCSLKEYF